MNKYTYLLVFMLLILTGCGKEAKEAQKRLDHVKQLVNENKLELAKSQIDTLRVLYPKRVEVLRESLTLMRQVDIKISERNIAFIDSLLPIRQHQADSMKVKFVLEKDTVYQEIGNYIYKGQTIERNLERSYIRSGVNEEGSMYLGSVYYGSGKLNHTALRVSIKDGTYAETTQIPYDGGQNYRFTDMGNTSEIVTYRGIECEDVVKFIYENQKEQIKAEYMGGKSYVIYIANGDKLAIATTFEFGMLLSDLHYMKKEKEKAIKRIEYLKARLEGKKPIADTDSIPE